MAFKERYATEREGQIEFFDNYSIPHDGDASVLIDNTDGVYNGCIIEFKLNISDLNRTLFQAIKYLSRMRIKGESVPARILLVDLNQKRMYVYSSQDYFEEIHRVYSGAASKDNDGFVAGDYDQLLDYGTMKGSSEVRKILKGHRKDPDEMYMPVRIDENCIVGWAERYYREKPNASKGAFLGDNVGTAIHENGEIRQPKHFKGLIIPYEGKTNEKFKYLMDCLNDRLNRKDLGAFYTPEPYARKAAELVKKAVERVPDGNDYVILDRCVDGNTEYFNGHEWKKISEYQEGEQVLQWNTDGSANLVTPLRYIDAPTDEEFYHYKSNTLDMWLSASHRIVYEDWKGNLKEKQAKNVFCDWSNYASGFRGKIRTTFTFNGDYTINEDVLRVAVMINADGSYQKRRSSVDGANKHLSNCNKLRKSHSIYVVRLHKERKIARARQILKASGLRYTEHTVKETRKESYLDGVYFLIEFPHFNPKEFPNEFFFLNEKCKRVVLDEVLLWDGCKNSEGQAFFSTNKHNIDIIQFMAASINQGNHVSTYECNSKPYYRLSFITKTKSSMYKADSAQFNIENTEKKYCFSVPSSYLVLRRNNKIFITGNCT